MHSPFDSVCHNAEAYFKLYDLNFNFTLHLHIYHHTSVKIEKSLFYEIIFRYYYNFGDCVLVLNNTSVPVRNNSQFILCNVGQGKIQPLGVKNRP